jgi:hypothetical protein
MPGGLRVRGIRGRVRAGSFRRLAFFASFRLLFAALFPLAADRVRFFRPEDEAMPFPFFVFRADARCGRSDCSLRRESMFGDPGSIAPPLNFG